MRRHIVVGVDGSGAGETALLWAAAEAGRRGVDLVIALAGDELSDGERRLSGARDESAEILRHSATTARAAGGPDVIETVLHEQPPPDLLLALGAGAELVVVGTHGRGWIAGALLGSVAHRVAEEAACPVAVVPERWCPTPVGRPRCIAVAVSASSAGLEALELAFCAAEQGGLPVLAVPARTPAAGRWRAMPAGSRHSAPDREVRQLVNLVRAAGHRHPGVEVVEQLSCSPSAGTLIVAGAGAQLLVVARHRPAGHLRSRLGLGAPHQLPSVPCPVLVTGRARPPGRGRSSAGAAEAVQGGPRPSSRRPLDPAGTAPVRAKSTP